MNDVSTNIDISYILGAVVAVGVLIYMLYMAYVAGKATGELGAYKGALSALDNVLADGTLLDLIEKFGKNFAQPAQSAIKGLDWLQTLTPDELDKVLEKAKDLIVKVTDGKPNTVSANETPTDVSTK